MDVRVALLQNVAHVDEVILLEIVEKVRDHPGLDQALGELLVVLFVQRRYIVDVHAPRL